MIITLLANFMWIGRPGLYEPNTCLCVGGGEGFFPGGGKVLNTVFTEYIKIMIKVHIFIQISGFPCHYLHMNYDGLKMCSGCL